MNEIEEMRKDLIEIFDEEYEKRRLITPQNTAEKMTAKGYRKQKVGRWVTEDYIAYCTICEIGRNIETQFAWEYCPYCGAKMG